MARPSTAVLLTASLLLLAGGVGQGAAAEPRRIDVIDSLSGAGSFLGLAEQQALQLLQNQVNAAGGLHGRPVAKLSDAPGASGVYNYVRTPQRGLDISNTVVSRWNVPALRWDVVSGQAAFRCRTTDQETRHDAPSHRRPCPYTAGLLQGG